MIEFLLKLFTRKTKLERLIIKADKLYKETGRQYFIMPTDLKGNLMLVHGRTFLDDYNRMAKKRGIRQMTFPDMINRCAYKTPSGTTNKR